MHSTTTSGALRESQLQQTAPPRLECWACRRRKLRCDGRRPICQTCRVSEIVCPGYTDQKPLTWLPTGATSRLIGSTKRLGAGPRPGSEMVVVAAALGGSESDSSSPETVVTYPVRFASDEVKKRRGRKRNAVAKRHQNSLGPKTMISIWPAPIDLRPAQWDFVDLMVFHKTHIVPAIKSKHDEMFPVQIQEINIDFLSGLPQSTRYGLLAQHFVYRIIFASKAGNLALEPTNSGPLAMLWVNFYRCVGNAVGALNNEIVQTVSSSVGGLLMSISLLVSAEINICSMPVWRAHVAGFFTLIKQCGGVSRVLSQLNPESRYYGQMFILLMFEYNATSPCHDQITQIYDLTMNDWAEVMDTDQYAIFYPAYPCADTLFLCAVEIAYLRRDYFLGLVTQGEANARLYDIISRVRAFSAEDWLESKRKQGSRYSALIAHIYKPTIMLFGILTVPCADPAIRAELKKLRKWCQATLFQLLELAFNDGIVLDYIIWPVVIGGISAATMGMEAERALVERYLLRSKDDICEGKPPQMALDVLQRFWASGKTGWDDCFDRMYTLTMI